MQATARTAIARPAANNNNFTAILLAVLAKAKTLLIAVAEFKYVVTIVSAVVSVFAYAWKFGMAGAIGFVALLFVHEMGHVIVLRKQGVPATLPLFIPFVGALIGMKAYPKGVVDEAYSAIAGPVLGSVGAFVCLAIYFATGQQIFAWLAYMGFFLNLFNLLPMSPLDGGRIIGAVWRGFWLLGVVAAVALATVLEAPILMLFSIFGLNEINNRFMRVHWAAYAVLGLLSVVSSVLCGDWIIGLIIAYFAYANAKKTYIYNRAETALSSRPRSFVIRGVKFCPLPASYSHSCKAARGKKIERLTVSKTVKPIDHNYFAVPKKQRFLIGTMYVGLSSVLTGFLIWLTMAGIFKPLH